MLSGERIERRPGHRPVSRGLHRRIEAGGHRRFRLKSKDVRAWRGGGKGGGGRDGESSKRKKEKVNKRRMISLDCWDSASSGRVFKADAMGRSRFGAASGLSDKF